MGAKKIEPKRLVIIVRDGNSGYDFAVELKGKPVSEDEQAIAVAGQALMKLLVDLSKEMRE